MEVLRTVSKTKNLCMDMFCVLMLLLFFFLFIIIIIIKKKLVIKNRMKRDCLQDNTINCGVAFQISLWLTIMKPSFFLDILSNHLK